MKIDRVLPNLRLIIEPKLARRDRRIVSRWKDLRSHRKLPMVGKIEGVGGRVSFWAVKNRLMMNLRRTMIKMMNKTKATNHISIYNILATRRRDCYAKFQS